MALRSVSGAGLRRAHLGGTRALTRAQAAALICLYGAAAVVATWPAVRSFPSAFMADGAPGFGEAAAGDHLQSVYRFWLVGHQLEQGEAPWRDPYSFQPLIEPQFVLGGWPFGLPFWPLDALFGPVVAWNLLLLAGIVAAGLLTYGWLRALSLAPAAAALGGLAFAIAPYRIMQSAGHLLGWVAILLPLCLFALERTRSAESRRAAHAWGALAALALVSIPLSGQVHLALGAVPFVLAYAGVRFRRNPFAWALGGALAATGVGLAIRYTVIAGSVEAGGRSLGEVELFQADWRDLADRFPPGPGNPFAAEQFIYLGWLTPLLALAGLVLLVRLGRHALAAVLGLGALVPVLLALGTNIPIYELLWDALPPFRFPRVPERLLPVADLALAALAAVAAGRVLLARRGTPIAAALLALVAADLVVQPLRASADDPGNRAYAALDQGRVLELPLFEPGIHLGSVYQYYTQQAPYERLGGYSTLAAPPAFDFFFRHNHLSCGVWLPGDAAELRRLGVTRVLFHAGLYPQSAVPGAWFGWRSLMREGYRPVARGGAVTLLAPGSGAAAAAPVPEPSHVEIVFCEGWRGFTMSERQAPLWIYGPGDLELELSAPERTPVSVWLDGERVRSAEIPGRGSLSVSLRGQRWHWLMLEIPGLFDTTPPRGLVIERLARTPSDGPS